MQETYHGRDEKKKGFVFFKQLIFVCFKLIKLQAALTLWTFTIYFSHFSWFSAKFHLTSHFTMFSPSKLNIKAKNVFINKLKKIQIV